MPALPAFQARPQETPLNDRAQQALTELLQAQAVRKRLHNRLDNVIRRLTDTAGQLNDRGAEQKMDLEKRQRRLQENGDEIDAEEQDQSEVFQKKVDVLTQKMDQGIRCAIDSQMWLDEVPQALQHVSAKTNAIAEALQRHGGRTVDADEEEDEGEQNQDQALPIQMDPSDAPSALLRETLSSSNATWSSKTPTDRYANNNNYLGFYRTVHDAKHPGDDAPPCPHASLWFAEEEGRERQSIVTSQRRSGRSAGDDEDSDLEVASERISIKCPLTLVAFKDPWKSKKCVHSFEKNAIMEMIDNATTYLPFSPAQVQELNNTRRPDQRARREREIGTPQVRCPVCTEQLTKADLEPNPVLQRQVRRKVEAEQRKKEAEEEEEEDEEDEDVPRGTQRRPPILGSSPPRRTSTKLENVKSELAKGRSGRQQQAARSPQTADGATVLELDDSEVEDEEMTDE